jgi:hypothetical protein
MVGNATFDHGTLRALWATVNGLKHPAGTTSTEHGDLNQHGRITSANCCNTNNHLQGHPHAHLYDLTTVGGIGAMGTL